MNLLLDTHALLWWLADADMTQAARDQIADPDTMVAVSAATIWEAEIKRSQGRLRFDGSLRAHAAAAGFEPLPISLEHAERAGALPAHHRDPFDRMLVAQAQSDGLTLVTRDDAIASYDVAVLRC